MMSGSRSSNSVFLILMMKIILPFYWISLLLFLWSAVPSFLPEVGSVRKAYLHKNISDLLDNLLRGYDNSIRPDFGGEPMEVEINLMVRSMGPISEVDMTYSMDMYFRQSWIDKRLSYSANKATLALSISMLEKIWKPDTYFYNGKQSYLHTITTPNKFVRLYQDGRVLYSSRLTVKASCPMHLEDFPMDTQRCPLKIGSFGYTTRDVIYLWKKGSQHVDIASDMKMSQFDLISTPSGNATDTLKSGERSVLEAHFYLRRHTGYFLLQVYFPCILLVAVSWVSFWINREATADRVTLGQYSCLLVNFHLQRHMGNFLIQVYGPCTLLVVLSWVSFWLNREATADRVSLGVTTVLTMTFLGLEARTDLPKVPYPTALDFFVFLSFAFIFATIIQFAVVHYFTKNGSGEVYFNDSSSSSEDSDDENENERRGNNDQPGSSRDQAGAGAGGFGMEFRPIRGTCSSTSASAAAAAIGGGCNPREIEILPYQQQMSIIEIPPPMFPCNPLKINNGSGLSASGEDSPSVIPGMPQSHAQPRHHRHHHGDHYMQNQSHLSASHHHKRENRRESTWSFCAKAYKKRMRKLKEKQRMELENVNSVSKIDKFARIFFPLSFLCINVFYWYSYLYKSSDEL